MTVLNDIRSQSDYRFPSIVKNSYKEDLKLSKAIIEKRLAQNFRKDLTERKLEKKKIENNAFYSRFIVFFYTKFTISDLKSKYAFYPN